MRKSAVLTFLFIVFSISSVFGQVIKSGDQYYLSGKIIVKFKSEESENRLQKQNIINEILGSDYEINQLYPSNTLQKGTSGDLSKIAEIKYNGPREPKYISKKLSNLENIEWAEPRYVYPLVYEPNDSSYLDGYQWYLHKINAEQAWDISKGSEEVVIGIVDTGVDWDHPDLAENIWNNPNEIEGNGIDDDNNGMIDDIRGWDFGGTTGTADNDPKEDRPDHGTHVAGIASGVTDNSIGIASIGFNCKIMPVKVSQDDVRDETGNALVVYGYEGIKYAADNGAKIVNCSWGGSGYSDYGKSIIDYVLEKGVLVVGAAGNEQRGDIIYPAKYFGVLSVGSTASDDKLSWFSNYGVELDVTAPGTSIYATWQDDDYDHLSGTSMASPLTAGLAGLVASKFTDYDPYQIAEQIRVNTDNIDNRNLPYAELIGSGRINAYKTLNNENSISVRATDIQLVDEVDDGVFLPGEKVEIRMNFKNYLSSILNFNVEISTSSSMIEILEGSKSYGGRTSGEEFDNYGDPFEFRIKEETPSNEQIRLKFEYSDGFGYTDFQGIEIFVNPSYRTQIGNDLKLSITSDGNIGFDDFPFNNVGDGWRFRDNGNILFEGALIYGTSQENLADAARTGSSSNQDFELIDPIRISVPGSKADYQGYTSFNEDILNLETELYTYSFTEAPDNQYIILEYNFINYTESLIEGFRTGLFFDLDIGASGSNFAKYDNEGNFGYSYLSGSDIDAPRYGAAVISNDKYGFHAINNGDSESGNIEIYNDFTKYEKWTSISSGLTVTETGPNDASMVTACGPFDIESQDTLTVAFVLAAGNGLSNLREQITQARIKYNQIVTSVNDENEESIPKVFSLEQNYPNPFNPVTNIAFRIPKSDKVKLEIFNVLGQKITTLVDEFLSPGVYIYKWNPDKNLNSGIYFYRITTESYLKTRKMLLVK